MSRLKLNNCSWRMFVMEIGEGDRYSLHKQMNLELHSYPSSIPFDIHDVLVQAGEIPNPFYGLNAERFGCKDAWSSFDYHQGDFSPDFSELEKKEFWICTEFDFDKRSDFEVDIISLGAIWECEYWLNGHSIGISKNAFIEHCFRVTKLLNNGKNYIGIRLVSGTQPKSESWRYHEIRTIKYSFGWDWAPRLINCGLYNDILLQEYQLVKLHQHHIKYDLNEQTANLKISVDLELLSEIGDDLFLTWNLIDQSGQCIKSLEQKFEADYKKTYLLTDSNVNRHKKSFDLTATKLHLWFPKDYGEPYCYQAVFQIHRQDQVICTDTKTVGFRNIYIDEPRLNEHESAFRFVVNGHKIWIRGANWVPPHSLWSQLTKKSDIERLSIAEEMGINLLRIWGGGYYAPDHLYEACNKRGILVWQDFMHACGFNKNFNAEWQKEIEVESKAAVRRLRHHPSLAVWCGSNETHEHWPLQGEDYEQNFGLHIMDRVIAEICQKEDPSRIFRPSSPYGGKLTNCEDCGDRHEWKMFVFQDESLEERINYKRFVLSKGKFISEFGVLGASFSDSIEKFMELSNDAFLQQEFKFHGNEFAKDTLIKQLELYWPKQKSINLQNYIKGTQYLQGEGYKYAIQHFRANDWYCGGSIFWMLHEAWDTSNGWSPTDYSLNRKIAFYRIKDAYKPTTFLWTLNYDMKSYSWAFVNDAKNLVKTELIYGLRDFEGNWVYQQKESINLCETERIYQSFDYDLTKFDTNGILYATWKDHNGETNFTWQFIGCPKSWGHIEDSVISVDILGSDKSFYKVEIHSQSFCPIVSLSDCHQTTFAQNYFPLFANEPVVIKVKEEDLAKLAPICYLNDNCKV